MLKRVVELKKGKKRKLEIDENDKENTKMRKINICLDSPETRKTDLNLPTQQKISASGALVTPDAPNRKSGKKLPPSARKLQQEILRAYTRYIPPIFPNVICIEGNIGSGKSTLLKQLESEFTVIQEPVATVWAKYLPLLYGDSKRWGMTFQMEALHWFNKLRTQILPQLLSQKVIIVERSPQSSTKIFARNMFHNGVITEWEHDVVARFFKAIEWKPSASIYLQVDVDTCCKRIKKRNRDGEDKIDRKLIADLNKYHEEVWARNKDPDIKVICVDASQPIELVAKQAKEIIFTKLLQIDDEE